MAAGGFFPRPTQAHLADTAGADQTGDDVPGITLGEQVFLVGEPGAQGHFLAAFLADEVLRGVGVVVDDELGSEPPGQGGYMKTGVSMTPWAVTRVPVRARPSPGPGRKVPGVCMGGPLYASGFTAKAGESS